MIRRRHPADNGLTDFGLGIFSLYFSVLPSSFKCI